MVAFEADWFVHEAGAPRMAPSVMVRSEIKSLHFRSLVHVAGEFIQLDAKGSGRRARSTVIV